MTIQVVFQLDISKWTQSYTSAELLYKSHPYYVVTERTYSTYVHAASAS